MPAPQPHNFDPPIVSTTDDGNTTITIGKQDGVCSNEGGGCGKPAYLTISGNYANAITESFCADCYAYMISGHGGLRLPPTHPKAKNDPWA